MVVGVHRVHVAYAVFLYLLMDTIVVLYDNSITNVKRKLDARRRLDFMFEMRFHTRPMSDLRSANVVVCLLSLRYMPTLFIRISRAFLISGMHDT